jgi:hypothetical protein
MTHLYVVAAALLRFILFTLCGAMLTSSVFLVHRFYRENNPYAAFGSVLYALVCVIALWGLLK